MKSQKKFYYYLLGFAALLIIGVSVYFNIKDFHQGKDRKLSSYEDGQYASDAYDSSSATDYYYADNGSTNGTELSIEFTKRYHQAILTNNTIEFTKTMIESKNLNSEIEPLSLIQFLIENKKFNNDMLRLLLQSSLKFESEYAAPYKHDRSVFIDYIKFAQANHAPKEFISLMHNYWKPFLN